MSIEQHVHQGFVHSALSHDDVRYCHVWLADDADKTSSMVVVMNAADCRNLADTLIEYAEHLESQAISTPEAGR